MLHEAFFYSSDEEFAGKLAPFLSEAIAIGQAAIAVTNEDRIELLRDRLGAEAAAVSFFDASRWYVRPGAALVAWRDALDERLRAGAESVRAISEIRFGTDPDAIARWTRYESLFNSAFADRPVWIVCPFDTRTLPEEVLAAGRRTHPMIATSVGRMPSSEHFERGELGAVLVPAADRGQLSDLRGSVVWPAHRAGLPGEVVGDLVLAISELARASSAKVRTSSVGGEWICEVEIERGGIDESLGLVIGRLICDRVELADREDRSVVRFVFGTPRPDPRRRILAAAAELFHRDGVRPTGISAVIERAGVAKATFYAYYPSKDDLVLAWLRSSHARWFGAVRAEVEARAESPAERLTVFFDVLGEWLAEDGFRGCPFLNTAAEFRDPAHPARRALAEYLGKIEEFFRQTAADAGLGDPEAVAAELTVLVPGTISTATARRSVEPASVASRAVAALRTDR